MAAISRLTYFYLAHFAKPVCDRTLYRAIRRNKVRRILAIGLGTGERAVRLIRTAQRYQTEEVRFTAVDMFEARQKSDPPGLKLKQAHQLLSATGAKVQLLPGDPYSALSRGANALQNTDLVIVAAGLNLDSLARVWFYVPRMLHAKSLVFEESIEAATGTPSLALLAHSTIDARAGAQGRRQAA